MHLLAWPVTPALLLAAAGVVVVVLVVSGRRRADPSITWPAKPDRERLRGGDTYLGYDLHRDGRLGYLQRLREGYKDRLYFPAAPGRLLREAVTRPATLPSEHPLLLLLLDGVAYERMHGLYEQGRFRLFRPPARLISVFPTLTDPAYDLLFGLGPTPGYEAGYFDRHANRLSNGMRVYLRGGNERWVRHSDYRLNFIEDAIMYLLPKWVYGNELRRARRVLDDRLSRGQKQVVIYLLTTDGLAHMLNPTELDRQLARLDDWLERVMYDHRGRLEIVMLSDHGLGRLPPRCDCVRRFDLRRVLREAGLRLTGRLARPGDVAVPLFGLLDVARLHTYDVATRDRALAALRPREEIELLAARDGDRVQVYAGDQAADIRRRSDGRGQALYSYEPTIGDPLKLADGCGALRAAARMDADGFASARAWLEATSKHEFPAAPPRLWDGLFSISREQPDIVASVNERWFVGSGLFSRFVRMQGTHGGLHRRVSETFVMTTSLDLASPLGLLDVLELLRREYGWRPETRRSQPAPGRVGDRIGERDTGGDRAARGRKTDCLVGFDPPRG